MLLNYVICMLYVLGDDLYTILSLPYINDLVVFYLVELVDVFETSTFIFLIFEL